MRNTHLEHIEDNILLGKESAYQTVEFLNNIVDSYISVKWDGAPAIVFGTDPKTGEFFVGTKSVFNKKKVKINFTHDDIDFNHSGRVASILHTCLECLPRVEEVYQGDFIGFGGSDSYRPNTIEYQFPCIQDASIIFAVHTKYLTTFGNYELRELEASFDFDKSTFVSNHKVKFVSDVAYLNRIPKRIKYLCLVAKLMIPFIKFPKQEEIANLKKRINTSIRDCSGYSVSVFYGNRLLYNLYKLVTEIKHLWIQNMSSLEKVDCYIADELTDHEGFVVTNGFGTFKLVNRRVFSYNNFILPKNW